MSFSLLFVSSSSSDSVRASASHFSRRRSTFAGPPSSSTRCGRLVVEAVVGVDAEHCVGRAGGVHFFSPIYAHVRKGPESVPLCCCRTALYSRFTPRESWQASRQQ